MFDVETLGKESNSVMLSMAAIYFDPKDSKSYHDYKKSAFFVKFDVEDQIKRLNRKLGKTTMQWWAKQCDNVKNVSFKPNKEIDVKFEDGYEQMRRWADSFNEPKSWVWARGNLDQLILDSFEEQLEIKPIWPFARWRDVRTAIDILYETDKGYTNVVVPPWIDSFDSTLHVTKHNPIDDCAFDIMQLLYGEKKDEQS
jgi:hypothetical protein